MTRPVLFVGDIHLGRSPHRLAAAGLDASKLDPAEAWLRVVRYAIRNDVQAVVLAGDVVDRDKDRFEAWGHLQRGVADLVDAGIRTLGVAGNHDHIALPRLAARIESFKLIGRGATWERVELEGIDLFGWSFPTRHHSDDPLISPGLAEAIAGRRPDALGVGVLHGDLDVRSSVYAPVRGADLAKQPLAAWFMGHVHQPNDLTTERPIGYLGSLVGLDRGEVGPRGPWLVTPTSASSLTAKQVPLGPVLWNKLEVNLADLVLTDDAQDIVHSAIEAAIARAAQGDDWLQEGDFSAVGCSVKFTGRIENRSCVARFIEQRSGTELVFETGKAQWVVVAMADETQPLRDLGALAAERTPLGRMADLVINLDARGQEAIPESVTTAVAGFEAGPWSADLERDPLPESVALTRSVALKIIDQLLAQRDQRELN